jgi:hypothetical protein
LRRKLTIASAANARNADVEACSPRAEQRRGFLFSSKPTGVLGGRQASAER